MQLSLLDRLTGVNVTAVNVTGVNTLGLLVEDMGRINFGVFDDSKVIYYFYKNNYFSHQF